MIVHHAQGHWPGQPLCGEHVADSSGTVTTLANYTRTDCEACIDALGGNVCVCGRPFIPGEPGASMAFCSPDCAGARLYA